jgi:hypothetical protein
MLQVVSFGMACNYSSVSGGTADHPPVLISLRLISPRKAILPTQVIAEDVDIQMDRIATAF